MWPLVAPIMSLRGIGPVSKNLRPPDQLSFTSLLDIHYR